MKKFNVIALTHRSLGLDLVGKFHIEPQLQAERFAAIEKSFGIHEFMFLSTCNRVEFFLRGNEEVDARWVENFLHAHYPEIASDQISEAAEKSRIYASIDAIRHLFHVSSSLDSLVVGEREIITQVREAFERAHKSGLAGDYIRLAVQKAIETAKQVYTETEIAIKPVSVVNIGFRKLIEREIHNNQSIAYIGAGQTIEAIAGNLKPYSFKSVKVFNRTVSKAESLAAVLGGQGYALSELESQLGHFDVLVTCTGSETAIVDERIYQNLIAKTPGRKVILDLALPNDISPRVVEQFDIDYISIESLKEEAKRNLKEREKEVFQCEALVEQRLLEFEEAFRSRKLELAMRAVPKAMKEIKSQALEKTFAKELAQMNEQDRENLLRIVNFIEKKYIALPMKMAKQVILDQDLKGPVVE